MTAYIFRRLLLIPIMLFLLSIFTFTTMRLIPGDVTASRLEFAYTEEAAQKLRTQLGIDKPVYQQYLIWVTDVVRGDLGRSMATGQPVSAEFRRRLPVTFELMMLIFLIQFPVGILLGVMSAVCRDRWQDYLARFGAIALLAIPNFWLATLVIIIPLYLWGWSLPVGYSALWDDPIRNLKQMSLPALVAGLSSSAIILRVARSQLLEVLRSDYIRTARAKGLAGRTVVFTHALRNALIPIVTIMGLSLAAGLSGSVISEQVFSIPGMGSHVVQAMVVRDYQTIQAFVLLVGSSFAIVNLLVDLSYGWLDPRIRVGR